MNHPTVLILSSDPAFSREVTSKWPRGRGVFDAPEFILLDPALPSDLNGGHYDLAIVDGGGNVDESVGGTESKRPSRSSLNKKLQALDQRMSSLSGKPAIVIHCDATLDFYVIKGSLIELRREPLIWPAIAGLVGSEILRRRQAEMRRDETEKICSAAQSEATLGRYMLDMRINVNNALTTLLGNAELLSLEAGLPVNVRAQADTIRNMALRLHEIFQRFSSLDKELGVTARASGEKSFSATSGRG
jgi:hypothetical protein